MRKEYPFTLGNSCSLANLSPAGVFPQMAARKTELPLKLTQLACLWFRDSRCWSTPQKPRGDGAQVCDTEGAHPHPPPPPSYFLCSRHWHRPHINPAFPSTPTFHRTTLIACFQLRCHSPLHLTQGLCSAPLPHYPPF